MEQVIKTIKKIPVLGSILKRYKKFFLYPLFIRDFIRFKAKNKNSGRFELSWKSRLVCLDDKISQTSFDRHYVYHPAWAARIIAETKPDYHIDISSTLHFCAIVSAFVPVRFYDYRPAKLELDNLVSERADLLRLPFENNSVKSLSCMHTVEHIGLGRYGDPIDPDGDLKAIMELERVLAFGGNLLFVVPIGKPRLLFNGHRIYSCRQIKEYFKNLKLIEFTLIRKKEDGGGLVRNAAEEMANEENYGCGCFWFKK